VKSIIDKFQAVLQNEEFTEFNGLTAKIKQRKWSNNSIGSLNYIKLGREEQKYKRISNKLIKEK